MLFKDILKEHEAGVDAAFKELFQTIEAKQTHEQDLLLVEINGYYEEHLSNLHSSPKLFPFGFGTGGWKYATDFTQYRFYDLYRKQMFFPSREEYFSDDKNEEKSKIYDFSLQMELMVYLKFWESDVVLTKLYQLSNLAQGKSYDWHFSIKKYDKRSKLIRKKIRDLIRNRCPKYYQLLKDIYSPQIRNAVAHSQFYIIENTLGFNNYDPSDHALLTQISFQEWEERFHKFILFYNCLIKYSNQYHQYYISKQEDKHFGLEIRITDKQEYVQSKWVKYVDLGLRKEWVWYD